MALTKEDLAAALKKLRESKSLSAADVARRAKIGQAIINRTESALQFPTFESLVPWLDVLGTTPGAFLRGLEADPDDDVIRSRPGFAEYYQLLTEIIESGEPFYVQGIHANLIAMSAKAQVVADAKAKAKASKDKKEIEAEPTTEEAGNVAHRERKRSLKQQRRLLR